MFLRLRWFVMGAATAVGVVGYLANEVRKARERVTPRNMASSGMRGVADLLDNAADAVTPNGRQR